MHTSVISTKEGRQWQGIPGIERAPSGRLWVVFYSGGPREPHADNAVLLTGSIDDGQTWTEPARLIDPEGSERAYDPTLWHDPAGRLWLIYNQADAATQTFGVWATTMAPGRDDAPGAWSPPRRLDLGVPFAFRMNKPIVLTNGDWLLPVTWAEAAPEGWFAHGHQLQGVAISADRGASWTLRGAVKAPAWALENMVVQLQNGVIWMLIRTGSGVLWQSFSHDGGWTWSEGSPTQIVNPGTRFFVRRLASGRLLLINTRHPEERTGLDACVSDADDEMSFRRCLELDDRTLVSYPDAVQAPDGRIYAVHDRDRHGAGEIRLTVFEEEEIL
jgi:predicted neuraminidase